MTLREFKSALHDPAYRRHIAECAFAGTLPPDTELLLLECAWGLPDDIHGTPLQQLRREMAQKYPQRFPRTTPWPKTPAIVIFLKLYRDHDNNMAATRAEIERRRTDSRWRPSWHQLEELIRMLNNEVPND